MVTDRKGQALTELALGMLCVAMVVTVLCIFVEGIAPRLAALNAYRANHPLIFKMEIQE